MNKVLQDEVVFELEVWPGPLQRCLLLQERQLCHEQVSLHLERYLLGEVQAALIVPRKVQQGNCVIVRCAAKFISALLKLDLVVALGETTIVNGTVVLAAVSWYMRVVVQAVVLGLTSPEEGHLQVLDIVKGCGLVFAGVPRLDLGVHAEHQLAGLTRPVVAAFVAEATHRLDEAERVQQICDGARADRQVRSVLEDDLLAASDGEVGLPILETQDEVAGSKRKRVLTDLVDLIKFQLQDALQLELVLKVVCQTDGVADLALLVPREADEIVINVIFQAQRRKIVEVVEHLLQPRRTTEWHSHILRDWLEETVNVERVVVDLVLED